MYTYNFLFKKVNQSNKKCLTIIQENFVEIEKNKALKYILKGHTA